MYGKKRHDVAGDNNPMRKLIKNGYKVPRKIKLSEKEIIDMYNSGFLQREIAVKAGCTQANISTILIANKATKAA